MLNNVIFSGKVFSDPQVKPVNKTKVANFGILNEEIGGKKTHLVGCEAWGALADVVMNLSKDDKVVVVGKLNQNSWEDDNGKRQSIVRIRVSSVDTGSVSSSDDVEQPQNEALPF